MNSRANVQPYNPRVLMGNWYEDRIMEEVEILFFKSISFSMIELYKL